MLLQNEDWAIDEAIGWCAVTGGHLGANTPELVGKVLQLMAMRRCMRSSRYRIVTGPSWQKRSDFLSALNFLAHSESSEKELKEMARLPGDASGIMSSSSHSWTPSLTSSSVTKITSSSLVKMLLPPKGSDWLSHPWLAMCHLLQPVPLWQQSRWFPSHLQPWRQSGLPLLLFFFLRTLGSNLLSVLPHLCPEPLWHRIRQVSVGRSVRLHLLQS